MKDEKENDELDDEIEMEALLAKLHDRAEEFKARHEQQGDDRALKGEVERLQRANDEARRSIEQMRAESARYELERDLTDTALKAGVPLQLVDLVRSYAAEFTRRDGELIHLATDGEPEQSVVDARFYMTAPEWFELMKEKTPALFKR